MNEVSVNPSHCVLQWWKHLNGKEMFVKNETLLHRDQLLIVHVMFQPCFWICSPGCPCFVHTFERQTYVNRNVSLPLFLPSFHMKNKWSLAWRNMYVTFKNITGSMTADILSYSDKQTLIWIVTIRNVHRIDHLVLSSNTVFFFLWYFPQCFTQSNFATFLDRIFLYQKGVLMVNVTLYPVPTFLWLAESHFFQKQLCFSYLH